jgi:hypothetical protein
LIDCGAFSQQCVQQCTQDLDQEELGALFDLQLCALQVCFFAGLCELGDFNSDMCVECRFAVSGNPEMVCADQGAACGVI